MTRLAVAIIATLLLVSIPADAEAGSAKTVKLKPGQVRVVPKKSNCLIHVGMPTENAVYVTCR